METIFFLRLKWPVFCFIVRKRSLHKVTAKLCSGMVPGKL
ncbi:hypothetical protein HMPREF9374_2110 [Desmospora sp. 8437]|nr:hypothetical protein HMPREF9374_2110 [Desmospora sp. 8437]